MTLFTGPEGDAGRDGLTPERGFEGIRGPQGPKGFQGPVGIAGLYQCTMATKNHQVLFIFQSTVVGAVHKLAKIVMSKTS